MQNNIECELILRRKVSNKIEIFNIIFSILILSVLSVSILFKYQTYLNVMGKVSYDSNKYELIVYIPIENSKYILNNSNLLIDNNNYQYKVNLIEEELFSDNIYNYQIIHLDLSLDKKYRISNYLIDIKIPKENKPLIDYLLI